MSREIARHERSRRPRVGADPDKAALVLPDDVAFPSEADKALVLAYIESLTRAISMRRVRLYEKRCEHCGTTDVCDAENMAFGLIPITAELLRASPRVLALLDVLPERGDLTELAALLDPPKFEAPTAIDSGTAPEEITARPDQT